MKDKLAKLVDLKSIITLTMVGASVFGFVTKLISAELFATWVGMVLTYYFVRKETK